MSLQVKVPDGRTISIPSDDLEMAKVVAVKWAQDNPIPEIDTTELAARLGEEDVSTFGDVLKAPVAGIANAVSGALSLPAELIDLATLDEGEASLAEGVRDIFDTITPTTRTGAGNAVKFLFQFGGAGWLGSSIAKARQMGKMGELAAFGAADVVATTPDVETLGDFFDTGPTKRIETEDLEASELAAANLINRFKVASEGTALLLGGPVIIKAAAKGVGSVAEKIARTDTARAAAEGIRAKILDNVGTKADLDNPGFISRNIKKLSSKLRFRGDMPTDIAQALRHLKIHSVSLANKKSRNAIEELTDGIKALNKSGQLNSTDESALLNSLNDYIFATPKGKTSREAVQAGAAKFLKSSDELFKNIDAKSWGGLGTKKEYSLFDSATRVRDDIDAMSKVIMTDLKLADDVLPKGKKLNEALIEVINNNMRFYGRTVYRALSDPDFDPLFKPGTQTIDPAKKIKLDSALDEIMASKSKKNPVTREEAELQLNTILTKVRDFSNANMKPKDMFLDDTLDGISNGILKEKTLDNFPAVRDFLGEYSAAKNVYGVIGRAKEKGGNFKYRKLRERDLDEQKVGLQYRVAETVSKMTNLIEQTNFYKNIKRHSDSLPEGQKFFFDEMPPGGIGQFQQIGDLKGGVPTPKSIAQFGPLAGKWIKSENIRAFTDMPQYIKLASDGSMFNRLYATFMGMKGMSQIAKTVYSPITQIRNATTAALFAIKNGNFGNGEDLVNSAKVVFQNINDNMAFRKGPTEFKGSGKSLATKEDIRIYYEEMVQRGIVNTNAKIGEFEDLLGDAAKFGYAPFGKRLLNIAQNTQNRFSGKLYQGSDDIWKIYSYEMELGRLNKAFENSTDSFKVRITDAQNSLEHGAKARDGFVDLRTMNEEDALEFLRRESAEIVKETVPNYARVPEVIKQLRQLPFGNFIAFPAEIIRTSMNSYGRAIRELASESPELRAIGMRRLMGGLTVDVVMPASLVSAGLVLTGSDREQLNAYKRSFAQNWDRYSTLVPMSTDKDGNIREFYNFSYTNPYDYLTRPARALWDATNAGITSEKELTDIAIHAGAETLKEMFSPFMDESIVTEKTIDLFRNQTRYGRNIWGGADPLGLKMAKGFAHFADGLTPGISPIRLRGDVAGQDVQLGDFTLGADIGDLPKAVGLAAGMDPVTGVNRKGHRIDAAGAFAEALTGLKSIKPRVETVLMYRGYEAGSQVREASGIFNRVAKAKTDMTPEDITQSYIVSNEARFRALRDLNMAIEDARTLGLTEGEIHKSLKKAKTPNLEMVMAGKFKPFYPTDETISLALEAQEDKLSNPFNFGEMSKIHGEQYGRSFLPEAQEEEKAERVRELIRLQQAQQAQQAQPPAPVVPELQTPEPPQTAPSPLTLSGSSSLRQIELNKLLGVR